MFSRICRACGYINPDVNSPGHIEMILTRKEQRAPKPEEVAQKKKISQRN